MPGLQRTIAAGILGVVSLELVGGASPLNRLVRPNRCHDVTSSTGTTR